MKQRMVGIRPEGREKLSDLAQRKKVSQQGLLTALVLMACGVRHDLGIISLDWDKIRREYPNNENRNKDRWQVVLDSVKTLMEEYDSAEEIASESRWTIKQVKRAMKELGCEKKCGVRRKIISSTEKKIRRIRNSYD